jgi:hypothetical protein
MENEHFLDNAWIYRGMYELITAQEWFSVGFLKASLNHLRVTSLRSLLYSARAKVTNLSLDDMQGSRSVLGKLR